MCFNFQGVFFGVSPSEDVNGIRSKELHFFSNHIASIFVVPH